MQLRFLFKLKIMFTMLKQCWPNLLRIGIFKSKNWHFQMQTKKNRDRNKQKSVFDRIDKKKMNNSLQIDVGMREVFASDSNINSIFSLRNFLDHNFLTSPTALLKPFNTIWIVKWSQLSYCFPIKNFHPQSFLHNCCRNTFQVDTRAKKEKT